jgi:hypothetical protein
VEEEGGSLLHAVAIASCKFNQAMKNCCSSRGSNRFVHKAASLLSHSVKRINYRKAGAELARAI